MEIIIDTIDVEFSVWNEGKVLKWIENAIAEEGKSLGEISYVFCTDEHLLGVNRQYLKHDFYTDIITFDYCEGDIIAGDMMISRDRVEENANEFGVEFENELHRVMIHGVLHLCGYKDKNPEDTKLMREKENYYLAKLNNGNC